MMAQFIKGSPQRFDANALMVALPNGGKLLLILDGDKVCLEEYDSDGEGVRGWRLDPTPYQ